LGATHSFASHVVELASLLFLVPHLIVLLTSKRLKQERVVPPVKDVKTKVATGTILEIPIKLAAMSSRVNQTEPPQLPLFPVLLQFAQRSSKTSQLESVALHAKPVLTILETGIRPEKIGQLAVLSIRACQMAQLWLDMCLAPPPFALLNSK